MHRRFLLIFALALVPALCAHAQSEPSTQPSAPVEVAEQQRLTTIASQDNQDALTQAFDVDGLQPDQRAFYLAVFHVDHASSDLELSREDRLDQLQKAAPDIIKNVSQLTDPNLLMQLGQLLAAHGVDDQTAVLEYWGPTDQGKGILRPIAEAACAVFARAAQIAASQATDLANRITRPDDPVADDWRKMNDLAGSAAYQTARMQYAYALSLDPADPRQSKQIDDAEAAFTQWDAPDSGIQPQARFMLAKLHLLRGAKSEIAAGTQLLGTLVSTGDDKPTPAASDALQFETRCFLVLAALEAGDISTAQSALQDATSDEQIHFASDAEQAATLRLLNYRILAFQADQATGDAKASANAAAMTALSKLVSDFPSLRSVIYQQLSGRVDPNADPATLPTLVLLSLVDQGKQQVILAGENGSEQPADAEQAASLRQSLAAARELMARYKDGKIPADQVVDASLMAGIFEEFLGDKFEAADALIDHIERFVKDDSPGVVAAAKLDFALDRARGIIADLRQSLPVDPHGKLDPRIQRLQDRFLPIAINPPFNRKEFAPEYATTLLAEGNWDAAAKYYEMTPDNDSPDQLLAARYGELVALKNKLDEETGLSDAKRNHAADHIQDLAESVRQLAAQVEDDGSTTDAEKTRARSTLARTALLAADVTRIDQNDPQRVLDLLTGFEDRVRGLPDAAALLNGALFLRVQSYMELGRNHDATMTLVQYLNGTGGGEGAQTVHDLLTVLNRDLDKTRAESDAAAASGNDAGQRAAQRSIRQLAANRAMLSGYLVQWAADSTDPSIHIRVYTYRRFDADSKRLAAEVQTNPQTRQKQLAAVLKLYQDLQSPENVAMYRAGLDANSGATADATDPLVTLGIGLTAWDLGDCQTVKQTLGELIQDQKLGEDNDQYWEATYKLLDCMTQLANANNPQTPISQVQQSLKVLYLIWRDGTGGPKWHAKFESLRKEVLPDWTPPTS
jgi:hypothetical protein